MPKCQVMIYYSCEWGKILFTDRLASMTSNYRIHTCEYLKKKTRRFKMNGYICFYKGKTIELTANTSYETQVQSAHTFKAKRPYEVTVVLCEIENKQVFHNASEFN